jgi:KTSC domain-containing protein
MNRMPGSSVGIVQVGYHLEAENLGTPELKFANVGVYDFFNVPARTYDKLMQSPSKESYYAANIGKRYPCSSVS